MRFQDAAPDARAIVYAGVQRDPLVARLGELLERATPAQSVLARAVMNGERADPDTWRTMVPACFPDERSEAILAAALEVADHGDQARNQLRGAIVETLTERLLRRRASSPGVVRRERRVLFDGVRSEIHPYDVTLETPGAAEAYDCKWGARGIGADVLHQLDDARRHADGEDQRLLVGLVVFDTRLACAVRLAGLSAPSEGIRLITIERLGSLAEGLAEAPP